MKALTALRETGNMAKKNLGGTVGTVATVASGVMSYNDARANGSGVVGAAAKGLTDALIIDLVGWKAYIGWQAAVGVSSLAKHAFVQSNESAREYNRLGTAGPFSTATHVDTEQTYTMRQAGLTQIQNNMFNTKKAVMGNEAMYMHR